MTNFPNLFSKTYNTFQQPNLLKSLKIFPIKIRLYNRDLLWHHTNMKLYKSLKEAELESKRLAEELAGPFTDLEWRALPSDEKKRIIEKSNKPIKDWVEQNPNVAIDELLKRLKKIIFEE